MKKPSVKTQVKICVTFVWIGALMALLSRSFGGWLLWAGLAVAAIASVCRYTLIRCPHCGCKLVDGQGVPNKCPNCGESLE